MNMCSIVYLKAMEKQISTIRAVFISVTVFSLLFSVPSHAGTWKKFEAVGVEYNVNSDPQIKGSRFKSRVGLFSDGAVRVVQIDNFISGKRKPDIHIKVAISSNSAGSIIYNSDMNPIAEYSGGKNISENLITFSQETEGRTLRGEWFIEDDYLMSDFSLVNSEGILLYRETVIYRAK